MRTWQEQTTYSVALTVSQRCTVAAGIIIIIMACIIFTANTKCLWAYTFQHFVEIDLYYFLFPFRLILVPLLLSVLDFIRLMIQQRVNASLGREAGKKNVFQNAVYLNFCYLSREQAASKRARVCEMWTCRIYVGTYGVGVGWLFLCVWRPSVT